MDLTLTPEQEMLVSSARSFLADACPVAHVRAMEADAVGFDRSIWREMARLGWTGLALPVEHGGAGLTMLETALVLEEMGRVLLPSPFVATAAIAAPLLLAFATDGVPAGWLSRIAAGDLVATLALFEPDWRDEWGTLEVRADGGRVSGTKLFVPFAPAADLVLVVVRGPALVAIERGAAGTTFDRLRTLDDGHAYSARFFAAPVIEIGALDESALESARQRAAVASLAYAIGAAERALEMTLEHAKTRTQFGRPIGSFQAVAHRCVDMRSDLDALRFLVYQAAWALGSDRPSALEVSTAKAYGNEALRRIFVHAHQVHGAIGFSTEHDLQLFTRRAKAAELAWGSTALHHERVARAMGL